MRILAVDDEFLTREELVDDIAAVCPNAEILSFEDGLDLFAEAEKDGCDIAFLDVHLRGLSGLDTAIRLQQICPKVNIIFVTGFNEYKADAMDMHASGYITKPVTAQKIQLEMEHLRYSLSPSRTKRKVKAVCFGSFDLLDQNGKSIYFARTKCKEMVAYLVYRHGTEVQTGEMARILFPESDGDIKSQGYVRVLLSQLRKSLAECNAEDIVIRNNANLSLDMDKVEADYFLYLNGDKDVLRFYNGEFMSQYAWAQDVKKYINN